MFTTSWISFLGSYARIRKRLIYVIDNLAMNNRLWFYSSCCFTTPCVLPFHWLQKKILRNYSMSKYDPFVFLTRRFCPAKAITTCQHQDWYSWKIRMITPRMPNVKTKTTNDPNLAGIKGMTFLSMERIAAVRAMGEVYSYGVINVSGIYFDVIWSL